MSDPAIVCLTAGGGHLSFHEGGGALFNSTDGRLYALNPVAGLTWLCRKDGLSRNSMANLLILSTTV